MAEPCLALEGRIIEPRKPHEAGVIEARIAVKPRAREIRFVVMDAVFEARFPGKFRRQERGARFEARSDEPGVPLEPRIPEARRLLESAQSKLTVGGPAGLIE